MVENAHFIDKYTGFERQGRLLNRICIDYCGKITRCDWPLFFIFVGYNFSIIDAVRVLCLQSALGHTKLCSITKQNRTLSIFLKSYSDKNK